MKQRINIDFWDDVDFHGRFRLTKPTVLRVLQIIEADITLVGTEERQNCYVYTYDIELNSAFCVTQIALHFAVRAVSRNFAILRVGVNATDFSEISQPSVSRILVRVMAALAKRRPDFIKMPESESSVQQRHKIAKFPLVIGAIDCTQYLGSFFIVASCVCVFVY